MIPGTNLIVKMGAKKDRGVAVGDLQVVRDVGVGFAGASAPAKPTPTSLKGKAAAQPQRVREYCRLFEKP